MRFVFFPFGAPLIRCAGLALGLAAAAAAAAADKAAPPSQPVLASMLASKLVCELCPPGEDNETRDLNLLLFEVRLDNSVLADSMTAYELGGDVLLPLGELTRLLTLGINVDWRTRVASGFVLREDRQFRLELQSETVLTEAGRQSFPRQQLRWIDGDIYVPARLLQRWLPIDLLLDRNSLTVAVVPRETLPIQARLARERLAGQLRGRRLGELVDRGYPMAPRDYRLLSVPFIDQTLGLQYNGGNGTSDASWAYSAFLTGDLLGMEASAYVSSSTSKTDPDLRLTLARNDPDGGLLGPLRARAVTLGNMGMPALANVLRGSSGDGVLLSNRPLNQPTSYGLQTLRGDLPPGWDVSLYFNDALIAFQPSRPDGLYEFADQPLVYGVNEFRLVFNGPLGQSRVERQVFILDQTLTKPGEFFYTLAGQDGADGGRRMSLQADLGLSKNLAATGGIVSLPLGIDGPPRRFANLGLRASALGMLLSGEYVQAEDTGSLYELGLRTMLGRYSLDLTHTRLQDDFVSDFFPESGDPIRARDRARLTGSIPLGARLRLPLGLDVKREETAAGVRSDSAAVRLSLNVLGTSLTNSLNYLSSAGSESVDGTLQISRRVAGIGLSGQIAYLVEPEAKVANYALTADKNFGNATRLSLGVLHLVDSGLNTYTAGLNHNFGSFGLGLSGRYSDDGNYGVGMQLFMALGRDPVGGRWLRDWQPMAGAGTVSARAFLDANMNGVFDAGEEPVQNACFTLNGGSRHPSCTNADGLAYLSRLTPKQYTDLALDPGTLEDPQWLSVKPGIRLLPRPGKVLSLDFPLVMTGEIDGTVYLAEQDRTRGIGNALIELVDPKGTVVASTRSANDGYYIVPSVRPGQYKLRIAPEQLAALELAPVPEKFIEMRADGEFVNGIDFTLRR